ncbi:hypothetical protein COEREDRAFT_11966 [Coemansia reversa NRRL 1564]|uniref:Uncharacterized protein n=1 Tax=Coemansia reversa (strain ATCC 12441 / NRRL 1564) TaxID=763665 RepID=A0A2G5B1R9_COERN|nr:hypothetical protein COEREDRAFT_11966 [Coemansia reversa NRRL 1564]|eukprot:PIA12931.1 hypothetical protein COEREDRAFT_11966 [Coemansia reversa NRRL 1564]
MGQGEWDSDSDYRQFNPGLYAMRQLGRSVSRRTRRLLLSGREVQLQEHGTSDTEEYPTRGSGAHPAGTGYLTYEYVRGEKNRRGPPLPSGIHQRSVSFDNLVLLPDTIPRRSTEPALGASPRSPSVGLPAASTWNSGTTASRATGSGRRRWMAGLAHPLSTGIDSEYHAQRLAEDAGARHVQIRFADTATGGMRSRAQYRERESFSGPAQLEASANLTDSQNSAVNTSNPFRHLWQGEDRAAADEQAPSHVRIERSEPIRAGARRQGSGGSGSRAGSGGQNASDTGEREQGQRLRGLVRAIGNISRRLTRIRGSRSASQPATPAEVRQSIMDSARQNMLRIPVGAGHEFYQFVVNPEDPVSDHDDPTPDSPTISHCLSSQRSGHRRSRTLPSPGLLQLEMAGADRHNNESPMHSSGSLEQNGESLIQRSRPLRHSTESLRRADAARSWRSSEVSVDTQPQMTNQGHNGTISALVQEKLASDFSRNVHISTRLGTGTGTDVRTESSYGTFVRFHPSGELNGIFVAGQSVDKDAAAGVALLAPMAHSRGEAYSADRHTRNQESIRRFVDDVRAARRDSAQQRRSEEEQQQMQRNDQAALDAALYVYGRQQGRDVSTLGTGSPDTPSTVLPGRRRSVSPARRALRGAEGHRRETVLGLFHPASPELPPALPPKPRPAVLTDKELPPLPDISHVSHASLRRSRSLSHLSSSSPPPEEPDDSRRRSRRRRARSGFFAGIFNRLASSHAGPRKLTRRGPRTAPVADSGGSNDDEVVEVAISEEPLSPPSVGVRVGVAPLSAAISAEIAHSAVHAPSATHRRMYAHVLQSLGSLESPSMVSGSLGAVLPDLDESGSHENCGNSSRSIGPAVPDTVLRDSGMAGLRSQAAEDATSSGALDASYGRVVRFRERCEAPERMSSVALDTITARPHGAQLREQHRNAAQSMPHSHATSRVDSPTGSLADFIASAGSGIMHTREPGLPGLEGFATPKSSAAPPDTDGILVSVDDLPVPTNDRLRRLEDAVLFAGRQPRTPPVLCESPVSDAGTGKTRILDFSETSVHADVCGRRFVARPEIKDVRGIAWPEADSALDLAPAAASTESRTALNSRERAGDKPSVKHVVEAALDYTAIQLQRASTSSDTQNQDLHNRGTLDHDAQSPAVQSQDNLDHSPERLAQLIQNSPDPRSLIYGAGSQFGSMRSHEESRSPQALARPPLPPATDPTSDNDVGVSKAAHVPKPAPTELSMAPVDIAQQTSSRSSFREYVEQQKNSPRATTAGREQRQFRVSLLDRNHQSITGRRARSASLPPLSSAPADAIRQRTRSCLAAPLVQALLLPSEPPSHGGVGSSTDSMLFSHLLGDGAALPNQAPSPPPPPPPFDPLRDTGTSGVPDSVLQAYMAGDLSAIDSFFAHIMHLTSPPSVLEADPDDDGDWSYGLEGPPPEVLARRALEDASRDISAMADISMDASRADVSGPSLTAAAPSDHDIALAPAAAASTAATTAAVTATGPTITAISSNSARGPPEPSAAVALDSGSAKAARKIAVPRRTRTTHQPSQTDKRLATEDAPCLSPARMPNRNARIRQTETGRRMPLPLPVTAPGDSKASEKRMLLARLRVLEGMIQKSTIEESRLQPPPALREERLAADIQSMESIYSSSLELDYDRIHRELSRSVRHRFDAQKVGAVEPSSQYYLLPTRANVLKNLRRGSQARGRSSFRASMLDRAAVTPHMSTSSGLHYVPEQQQQQHWSKMAEPATSASIPGPVRNMSSLSEDIPEIAYSARSNGSLQIDVIDSTSAPGSPVIEAPALHPDFRVSNTGRFRRTAKLLAL